MVGFVIDNGVAYAGSHLLIDLYGCSNHGSLEEIRSIMIESCVATGATVLFSYLHPFTGGGVSGAVILAESHESIHTWPEAGFISLDIFVCGQCDPYKALPVLEGWFKPARTAIKLEKRGICSVPSSLIDPKNE
jgi:S-adenosylmethionine decarboxylase